MSLVDLSDVEVQQAGEWECLPEGYYWVAVEDSTVRETHDGTGTYIKTKLRVLDGPHTKRVLWHNFHLTNRNPEAVRISKQQLKGLLTASGVEKNKIENAEELMGLSCDAKVALKVLNPVEKENRIQFFRTHKEEKKTASDEMGF